jgi:hypothetical protein
VVAGQSVIFVDDSDIVPQNKVVRCEAVPSNVYGWDEKSCEGPPKFTSIGAPLVRELSARGVHRETNAMPC